jgi:topoisomerase IV subunit A
MEENSSYSGEASVMVSDMYQSWFLDYASYVILERAVPAIEDGLKPVQRRILHAMREMDDGRFNKVANVIGQTMQYHPHGDASISDAITAIGQKELLIETQGNWGDVRTGDPAAAARYIEARLSKFALEVVFNPKTTKWQLSYDGRKNEPVTLPVKFPLLLAQGTDGIAVGLSTKILPHNFCELIEAAIHYLKGEAFELYPDFLHGGGMVDVSNYNDGLRGGKVRVRARIVEGDKKTLLIKSIPYSITTSQLVDSILKANDNGKIKIKSVIDNTAKDVELNISLPPGTDIAQTIDALYAFTDCEISISPNACVIMEDKPHFVTVSDLLKYSVDHTQKLLLQELNIRLGELNDDWHYSSLEKIFIENKIYRDIEEETTWEGVIAAIDAGLEPYKKLLRRTVTVEDITELTEIKIKRISKYDALKADEHIRGVEREIDEVTENITKLNPYTVRYFEHLLKKYGKGRERVTEIRVFENIQATSVAIANTKLYVNKKEGFLGTSLKKDEFAFDCSDLDHIIVFRRDGKMMVTKVADKTFVGKDIIHIAVFQKNDERTTYNLLYTDGKNGITYGKRFNVTGITRDKEYDLTRGNAGSKVIYLTANANGEAEVLTINLHPGSKARNKNLDYYFEELEIKSKTAQGNQVTKYPVKSTKMKEKGRSTLSALKIYFDGTVGRLNKEGAGNLLGLFAEKDRIIAFYKDGMYELTDYELTNRFETANLLLIEKFHPERVVTAAYFDAKSKQFNIKRFLVESQTLRNKYSFIKEGEGNYLAMVSTAEEPIAVLKKQGPNGTTYEQKIQVFETIEVTGWKTVGTTLASADTLDLYFTTPERDDVAATGQSSLF